MLRSNSTHVCWEVSYLPKDMTTIVLIKGRPTLTSKLTFGIELSITQTLRLSSILLVIYLAMFSFQVPTLYLLVRLIHWAFRVVLPPSPLYCITTHPSMESHILCLPFASLNYFLATIHHSHWCLMSDAFSSKLFGWLSYQQTCFIQIISSRVVSSQSIVLYTLMCTYSILSLIYTITSLFEQQLL